MQVELTLKNYRCFSDAKPARISIQNGFTAFVGVNNSGKSSLVRFLYEFRSLFGAMRPAGNNLLQSLTGLQVFSPAASTRDINEIFCNTNDRDLIIDIRFPSVGESERENRSPPGPSRITVTVPRGSNNWRSEIFLADGRQLLDVSAGNWRIDNSILCLENTPHAELITLDETLLALINTLYIGPFRNAINIGSREDYFDITTGEAFVRRWDLYKTGPVIKENEAAYRLTKDIQRIFKINDLDINASPDNRTLQIFIDGKSYALQELGSGLAQFIIVLANAATRQPSFILIDEPELNLHPSLQLDFFDHADFVCYYGRHVCHP